MSDPFQEPAIMHKEPVPIPANSLRSNSEMAILPAAPVQSGWLSIIEKMVDKGVPIEQLDKLLELQQKWEREQARKAYVAALSAFKANAPTLTKNKKVGFDPKAGGQRVEYTHITLAEACRVLIPALAEHGMSHGWETKQLDGGLIEVTCRLSHAAGHSETVMLKSVPDNSGAKNAIQAVMSTVSYLERYTFLAIVGMAAEDMDNDGKDGAPAATVSESQLETLKTLLDDTNLGAERFKKFLAVHGVERLDELPVRNFDEACRQLRAVIEKNKREAN